MISLRRYLQRMVRSNRRMMQKYHEALPGFYAQLDAQLKMLAFFDWLHGQEHEDCREVKRG